MLFKSLANRPDPTRSVPTFWEKTAYGTADFASQLMYCPIAVYLIYYYTNYLNVNIAAVSSIILASRLLDGVSDLVMGILIDKTRSPYGKTRAWLLRSILPFVIALTALFAVPVDASETVKLVYIFITYNFAVTVVFTMMNVPYGALSTLMTKDPYQRSLVAVFRMIMAAAGIVFINALTMPLVKLFGDTPQAWTYTYGIFALLGGALIFLTFAVCHERFQADPAEQEKTAQLPIREQLSSMLHNRYWLLLCAIVCFVYIGDVTYNTANIYFCRYFLNSPEITGSFNVVINVGKIVAMVLLVPLAVRKLGKRTPLAISCALVAVSFALRYFFPLSITVNYISAGLVGLCYGVVYACIFSMIPDTVEYGEYVQHKRQEGLVFSGSSFGMKLAAGLGTVVAGFAIDAGGFVNEATVQSDSAMQAILLTCTWLPVACFVLAAIGCSFYRLDKLYPQIIKELVSRKQKAAVQTAAA